MNENVCIFVEGPSLALCTCMNHCCGASEVDNRCVVVGAVLCVIDTTEILCFHRPRGTLVTEDA